MKLIMLISPWIRRLIVFIGMGYALKISLDDLGLRTREKGIVYARNDGNEGEKGMGINGRWHCFKANIHNEIVRWSFYDTSHR